MAAGRVAGLALDALPRAAALAGALAGLAPVAAACPSCGLSLDGRTLVYIAAFLVVPYLIVSGVVVWVRRLLRAEAEAR